MSSKHTPEPWSINDWPQGDAEIRIGAVGYPRIAAVLLKYESINGQKANAERIVACVNACAGIADPAAFIRDLHTLLVDVHDTAHTDREWPEVYKRLREAITSTAIAKAET